MSCTMGFVLHNFVVIITNNALFVLKLISHDHYTVSSFPIFSLKILGTWYLHIKLKTVINFVSRSRSSCAMAIYYESNIFIEYLRLSFQVINYHNELTLGRYRSAKESPDKLGMTDLGRRRSSNRSRRLRTRVET